ncbi:MAG: hypothetical protein JRI86_10530 [Deltaproteobacteria bacterium]|nr:hypothetical protein [Deltaproteobacteria bacterium]
MKNATFKIGFLILASVFIFICTAQGQDGTIVFKETFGQSEVKPFTGAETENTWTVTGDSPELRGQGEADHTGDGVGMETKSTGTLTDTMLEATVDAKGSSGYIEFWVLVMDPPESGGWTFQVDSGGGYVTKLSEETASQHEYQKYHYDLEKKDLISNLKIRFQFNHTPERMVLDDIVVVVKK